MIKTYFKEDVNIEINNDIDDNKSLKENLFELTKWEYLYYKLKDNKAFHQNKR
jgi:hypothetical protein